LGCIGGAATLERGGDAGLHGERAVFAVPQTAVFIQNDGKAASKSFAAWEELCA